MPKVPVSQRETAKIVCFKPSLSRNCCAMSPPVLQVSVHVLDVASFARHGAVDATACAHNTDACVASVETDNVEAQPSVNSSVKTLPPTVQVPPDPCLVVQLPECVPLPSSLPQDQCVERICAHLRGEHYVDKKPPGGELAGYGAPLMSMHSVEVLCTSFTGFCERCIWVPS